MPTDAVPAIQNVSADEARYGHRSNHADDHHHGDQLHQSKAALSGGLALIKLPDR